MELKHRIKQTLVQVKTMKSNLDNLEFTLNEMIKELEQD